MTGALPFEILALVRLGNLTTLSYQLPEFEKRGAGVQIELNSDDANSFFTNCEADDDSDTDDGGDDDSDTDDHSYHLSSNDATLTPTASIF